MAEPSSSIALPSDLFAGKTAIVTGASRGVGRATALRLAEGGANVVVNYLSNHGEADETVRLCQEKGVEAIAVQADVSDYPGDGRSPRTAREVRPHRSARLQRGRLGRRPDRRDVRRTLEQGHQHEPEIRVGRVKGVRSRDEKTAESGAIVMVSSTSGQRGEANYSNYSASKGGQISFTKALASELCPKIRVNAVAPGWIETAMVRPVFEDKEYKQSVLRSIPLNRMATTDDVALSICFLLSDWSRHITGEILNINGGAVLCG